MNTINPNHLKDQVCLVDLLARLGHHPIKSGPKELRYISMLCHPGEHRAFSVNQDLGMWYDHGLGRGGDIIDFGMAYWKLSFQDTLERILQTVAQPEVKTDGHRRRHARKLPHYQIEQVAVLGNNSAITAYLKERGIWLTAQGRLKELYYFVEDEKKHRKNFFAAGHQNETGSWEVRSKYFRGCLGHKAMTIVHGSPERLSIFEDYFDYLSWLDENEPSGSAIITNNLTLLPQVISKASEFDTIDLYFDHDQAGREATLQFKKQITRANDRSIAYQHYNDYNEKSTSGICNKNRDIFHYAFARI